MKTSVITDEQSRKGNGREVSVEENWGSGFRK